jgi:phosphopantothenoylcysteine decarboxylase/phosphopantothenate--cysteine ligase
VPILENKRVVLVISGGIAAYKAAELARLLIREGALVRTAMTEAGSRFITPLTMQTLTGQPVALDLWAEDEPDRVAHIDLADWAQAVVVAPATANLVAKMAHGLADDLVSTFLLAVRAPVLVCPSMNVNMYDHPRVQANLAVVQQNASVMTPASGFLACGWEGRGRLPEPPEIIEGLKAMLTPQDMAGKTVLVTSGPTREAWDPIRYLSNRSTGQMGRALAVVALRRGAKVIYVTGPTALTPPQGAEVISVQSTLDMLQAVKTNLQRSDIVVKAAAPSDFRPADCCEQKIKKGHIPSPIALVPNPDILKEIAPIKGDRVVVGFAAESQQLIERAKAKLEEKKLDLIVANQIGAPDESFGAATNRVWIVDRAGGVEEVPLMSKEEVAGRIWDRALGARHDDQG